MTNNMLLFPPVNVWILLHCVMGIKNATALQGQILMHRKSASEHNFSGVGYGFKTFQ